MSNATLHHPNGPVKVNGHDSGILGEVHLPQGMKFRIPKTATSSQGSTAQTEVHIRVTDETLKLAMRIKFTLLLTAMALGTVIYIVHVLNA